MSPSIQRWIRLIEPVDDGQILVNRVRGKESVSRLFEFDVLLATPVANADRLDQLLGKPLALELNLPGGPVRTLAGMVREIEFVEENERMVWCSAKLVPSIWPLSQNRRSRVFQNLTTPKILSQIFERQDVVFHLRDSYLPHAYCVQYGESDFAFACRLMEEEGIYYYFEFEGSKCRLAVADNSPQSTALPGRSESSLSRDGSLAAVRQQTVVQQWRPRRRLTPSKVAIADHSFELTNPVVAAQSSATQEVLVGSSSYPLHPAGFNAIVEEYPAGHAHRFDGIGPHGENRSQTLEGIFNEGNRLAQRRLQREQRQSVIIEGAGDCAHFAPGYSFRLADAGRNDGEYFLTSIEHDAWQPVNAGETPEKTEYRNRFRCTPKDFFYRPAAKTRKPTMQGMQTALVVGPPGDDIYTDPFGRVKVRFFWDNSSASAGDSSCWLRVSHGWAGKGWGMMTIPRVGQEVLVGFIEGDPDMPIIVGSVYNANQPPPAPLPALKTVSGFVSRTDGGDSEQYNRIIMCDQPGQELVQLHSERNLMVTAENSHSTYVRNQHTTMVGGGYRVAAGGATLQLSPSSASGAGGASGSIYPENVNTGQVVGWSEGFGSWANPFSSWSNFGNDIELIMALDGSLEFDCAGALSTVVFGMNESTTMGFGSRTLLGLNAPISSISNNGYFPASFWGVFPSWKPWTAFGLFHVYGVEAVKLGDVQTNFGFTTSLAYGSRFSATHGTSWRAVGDSTVAATPLSVVCKLYTLACMSDVMINAALPEVIGLDPDKAGYKYASDGLTGLKAILLAAMCGIEYFAFNSTAALRRSAEFAQLNSSLALLPEQALNDFTSVMEMVETNAAAFTSTLTSSHSVGTASDDLELIQGNSVCMASNISLLATPSAGSTALISICAGGPDPTVNQGVVSVVGSSSTVIRGNAAQIVLSGGTPSIEAAVPPQGGAISIATGTSGTIELNPGTTGSITLQNGETPNYTVSLTSGSSKIRHGQSLSLGLAADNETPLMPAISIGNTASGPSLTIALSNTMSIAFDPTAGITLKAGSNQISISPNNGIVLSSNGDKIAIGSGSALGISTSRSVNIGANANVNLMGKKVNTTLM